MSSTGGNAGDEQEQLSPLDPGVPARAAAESVLKGVTLLWTAAAEVCMRVGVGGAGPARIALLCLWQGVLLCNTNSHLDSLLTPSP
jgi:hypothetical protein